MNGYRYVILDPTGNLTALVLDPVPPEQQAEVTRELLRVSEQVAFLHPASGPDAEASIRLMGGEFCGNAAMASAAWLTRDRLEPGEETALFLEVSGAKEAVPCRIRRTEEDFEGTVRMPPVLGVTEEEYFGMPMTAVRMEGILHLILEGQQPEKEHAEHLLKRIAGILPDEAIGLLQWNREQRILRPLVYVRSCGSMVWENGCGSGSAAVGVREALNRGEGITETEIRQPGGTIRAAAVIRDGRADQVTITGKVRIGREGEIQPKNNPSS